MNGEQGWKEYDSTTGVLYDTYHNLKRRDLQFFKSLSHRDELDFEGLLPITICHGSPENVSEKAPYWCSVSEHLLRTGEISHGTVLARAMALCKSKFGECNWPNVQEECWRQAVKEKVK